MHYNFRNHLILSLLFFSLISCNSSHQDSEVYYTKQVQLPPESSLSEKVDIASRLVPTPEQLAWQQLELTAFVHFGINTFTGKEWGEGDENPEQFVPTDLDTDQWVRVLKEAGFRMVILTAKHHEGFCLWPTETTDFSVKSSPWREGKGDVVADLRASCDKYDMRMGIYLSPWDRNSPLYGQGEAYNDLYIAQLTELLTNYGQIDEVWLDGANGEGPNGKKQEYDFTRILDTVHRLQPQAVTAIMGDDIRWVGNEKGLGRQTEWSATPFAPAAYPENRDQNKRLGISETSEDLGSRELLSQAETLYWYPSEVDVSIRPGWFYHESEDSSVKSLAELAHIYFNSVGMNSVLLLNIPPDRRGKFADPDIARLQEFGKYIQDLHSSDAVRETDSPVIHKDSTATVEVATDLSRPWDVLSLSEDISKGQRIESFRIDALRDGEWVPLTSGTTIGYRRMLLLDKPVQVERIRVTVTEYRGTRPHLREVHTYLRPEIK